MTLIDVEYKLFSVPGRTPKRKAGGSNPPRDARLFTRKISHEVLLVFSDKN